MTTCLTPDPCPSVNTVIFWLGETKTRLLPHIIASQISSLQAALRKPAPALIRCPVAYRYRYRTSNQNLPLTRSRLTQTNCLRHTVQVERFLFFSQHIQY